MMKERLEQALKIIEALETWLPDEYPARFQVARAEWKGKVRRELEAPIPAAVNSFEAMREALEWCKRQLDTIAAEKYPDLEPRMRQFTGSIAAEAALNLTDGKEQP
jgi:hypothetical protein